MELIRTNFRAYLILRTESWVFRAYIFSRIAEMPHFAQISVEITLFAIPNFTSNLKIRAFFIEVENYHFIKRNEIC